MELAGGNTLESFISEISQAIVACQEQTLVVPPNVDKDEVIVAILIHIGYLDIEQKVIVPAGTSWLTEVDW